MVGMFPFTHGILGAGGFQTAAANFDGVTDTIARGADMTGNADSNTLVFSAFLRLGTTLGAMGVDQVVWANEGAFTRIRITTANQIVAIVQSSTTIGFTTFCNIQSTGTISSTNGWQHIGLSCNGSSFALMRNGTTDWSSSAFVSTLTADWTRTDHWFGSGDGSTSNVLNADVAEVFLHTSTYIDLRSNITLFRDSAGKPVNLGTSGATPTGSQPIVYFQRAVGATASTFAANLGTGGAFTITGALTNSTSSPSD